MIQKSHLLTLFVIVGLVGLVGLAGMFFRPMERSTDSTNSDGVNSQRVTDVDESDVELDEGKQKDIWQSEHITFKIETHFGKPFVESLKSRDSLPLTEFFRSDCQGKVLSAKTGATHSVSVVSETEIRSDQSADTSYPAGTSPTEDTDRDGLVKTLIDSIDDLHEFERGRLRVLKIEPEIDLQDGWRTQLLLTCSGKNQEGHLVALHSEHDVVFQFVQANGTEEKPVAVKWETISQGVREAPKPLMDEVTAEFGLDRVDIVDQWNVPAQLRKPYVFQTAVADYDRDGYLDIAIASSSLKPILLRSLEGRRFEDKAEFVGLKPWRAPSALASWIDFNDDGFPDLLMGNRLYRNVRGVTFDDVTSSSGLEIGFAPVGCVVADYDCDGLLDLYVMYQDSPTPPTAKPSWVGDSLTGVENQLWRNEGNGRFRNVTEDSSADGDRRLTQAATWFFHDDDHLPDLYIANDFGSNVLYRNKGNGSFEDITVEAACEDFATSMGVASGDINNDGATELYVANMYSKMGRRIIENVCDDDYPPGVFQQIQGSCQGNTLYSRTAESSQYEEMSDRLGVNKVGWAWAPTMIDCDNDGWLDLYATTGYKSFTRNKPDG